MLSRASCHARSQDHGVTMREGLTDGANAQDRHGTRGLFCCGTLFVAAEAQQGGRYDNLAYTKPLWPEIRLLPSDRAARGISSSSTGCKGSRTIL